MNKQTDDGINGMVEWTNERMNEQTNEWANE